MFRVTSPTKMDDRQLNRWIRRVLLLLVLGTIAFVAFYALDRWRPATTPIVDQRLAALEAAVRDKPDDVAARGQLADTYVAKGRYEDALVQYDAIVATGKADELARYGRAGAYVGLGRLDDAAQDYQAVVDIARDGEMANVDPMLQASYYSLGSIAMQQGRPAAAIPFLEQALAIRRSDADALYLIGTAYVATGATDKAEAALRAAVAYVPIGWSEPYAALAEGFTKAARPPWPSGPARWRTSPPASRTSPSRASCDRDGEAAVDAAIGLGLLNETRGATARRRRVVRKALAASPANARPASG